MSKQIMVVDDDAGLLALIGVILKRAGYTVLKAKDAFAALETLEESKPDLFILDVMMPQMDGFELCRKIRSEPNSATTPVIILSARGDAESVEEGMQAGADDYLTKPIFHNDLLDKVRSTLNDQSLQ